MAEIVVILLMLLTFAAWKLKDNERIWKDREYAWRQKLAAEVRNAEDLGFQRGLDAAFVSLRKSSQKEEAARLHGKGSKSE